VDEARAQAYIDESDAMIHAQIEDDLAKLDRNTRDTSHITGWHETGRIIGHRRPYPESHVGYNPYQPVREMVPGPSSPAYHPTLGGVPPPNPNGWQPRKDSRAYNPATHSFKK
jgi:hypothetical protein